MHEDLLGYLLGALEPHEMERVEAWLKEDAEARRQLVEIERSLRKLEDHTEPIEPAPSDLVQRTLDALPPMPVADDTADDEVHSLDEFWFDPDQVNQTPQGHVTPSSNSGNWSGAGNSLGSDNSSGGNYSTFHPMTPEHRVPRNRSMHWIDVAALSMAAAVLLALLIPAILQDRFEARRVACHEQLRNIGVAITQFVVQSEQSRLPAVAEKGPEAFAGVYAVRLADAGLLPDPAVRWCPSLDAPGSKDYRFAEINELPSVNELREAPVDQLRMFQEYAGGHYAYTLGVIDKDKFAPPRFESRASFAVLSDAPLAGNPTEANFSESIGHGGTGINVLYEDGRVDFVSLASLRSMPDHPLFNHHGEVEAGVNVDDASLAPSWRPPFVEVRQR
ncbi:hypothetical protein Pla22_01130 [Rubripirellula amarantea]|uniref:DUF1559 domain-containing protein n=1 Tax=Rubripirellula amarantea TaxID=2527999 RepID=A0A5C5WQQ8_9BACT|nr:hypothetical protein [Rubripirellula amarantea]TWT52489.1 hypothetical protein Pla22_01130 [Rubripirellula amarantea]